MGATTFMWLVLLCPLVGMLIISLGWRVLPGRAAGVIGTLAIGLSFAFSVAALVSLLSLSPSRRVLTSSLWNYASTAGVDAKISILVDPLSVFMALTVSGVSMLIHLYSISYLDSDRGFRRYFAYLNYFVFSMLLLVTAGNFVQLIIGWAFVGAASYLLISFWYRRTTATRAGIKAFVINVIGDVGLVLGTFFIFRHTGTVDLLKTFHAVPHVFTHNNPDLVAGCSAPARQRLCQVRAGPAAHVAPGRDGGPDAGLGADPRRHDGHRRRLPDHADASPVRVRSDRG